MEYQKKIMCVLCSFILFSKVIKYMHCTLQKLLCKTVSVVFHLLANTRFNTSFEEAISTNVTGTRKIIKLCHALENLEVNFIMYMNIKN